MLACLWDQGKRSTASSSLRTSCLECLKASKKTWVAGGQIWPRALTSLPSLKHWSWGGGRLENLHLRSRLVKLKQKTCEMVQQVKALAMQAWPPEFDPRKVEGENPPCRIVP